MAFGIPSQSYLARRLKPSSHTCNSIGIFAETRHLINLVWIANNPPTEISINHDAKRVTAIGCEPQSATLTFGDKILYRILVKLFWFAYICIWKCLCVLATRYIQILIKLFHEMDASSESGTPGSQRHSSLIYTGHQMMSTLSRMPSM